MKITTDTIVGTGLVIVLLASIFLSSSTEMQTTIASGLIGYLGRTITAGQTGGTAKREDGANGSNQQKQPA